MTHHFDFRLRGLSIVAKVRDDADVDRLIVHELHEVELKISVQLNRDSKPLELQK